MGSQGLDTENSAGHWRKAKTETAFIDRGRLFAAIKRNRWSETRK